MIFLGVDPDLHCTAIGAWVQDKPFGAWVVETPKIKGRVEQTAVLDMVWAIKESFPLFSKSDVTETIWAVEAQTLHVTGLKQHKRPQDIVTLGNVGGAVLQFIAGHCKSSDNLLFPTAKEWKGQIPKAVMQARFYQELGWGYQIMGKNKSRPNGEYSLPRRVPSGLSYLKKAHWKHVGDALMLAKWASINWKEQ